VTLAWGQKPLQIKYKLISLLCIKALFCTMTEVRQSCSLCKHSPTRRRLGCDRSRASARYQRQPARNLLQSLPWRFLSLGETSVVCAGPACRGRLRCMLFCRSWVAALRSGSLFSGRPAPADVHGMAIQSTCEKSCP